MNTAQLKAYAPKARKDFIEAIMARAAKFGITESDPVEMMVRDDVAMIYGEAYPKEVFQQREGVLNLVKAKGFEPAMEAMAYTWFNRIMALRYMELHGFLDHGYRVLSHPEGASDPEILQHARHVDLPDLDQAQVADLLLAGNRDEELYRILLLGQCHALHVAMPFLFEPIDDATELLLPDNLLHSDSLIRKLVNEIPEESWETVEVVGWLYQFYISERKDQVIGKVVKSEDIPAATQLFTPNWIVKYMVQNSLGAQWLATYPDSKLKAQMDYFIEPAEQTDEVNAQLAAITPNQLNPEELTLIDPASGSGHILVEAYELFKAIYLERGYRQQDVPQLILEKNLYGLDIDERAAQLTGFALMMKGRADDRRLFERGVKLNVMALVDSAGFDAEGLAKGVELSDYGLKSGDLTELKRLFEYGTTFGSLIQVPEKLVERLAALKQLRNASSQDLFVAGALKRLGPLVQQAEFLAAQYDAVVANPPYMGSKSGMNVLVKQFAKDKYQEAKSDLFACFVERGFTLARNGGDIAMVTMQSWMFLSGFQKMRERILREKTISTMAHLGARAFGSISGEIVQTTASVLRNASTMGWMPVFIRLVRGGEVEKQTTLASGTERYDTTRQGDFSKIPGSPLAYWVSDKFRATFERNRCIKDYTTCIQGIITGNTDRFLRLWHEPSYRSIALGFSQIKTIDITEQYWIPYTKGGELRKWFGNNEYVVFWRDRGRGLVRARTTNAEFYLQPCMTWTLISSSYFSARYCPEGFLWDVSGSISFPHSDEKIHFLLALLCSKFSQYSLASINPTLNTNIENVETIPVVEPNASLFSLVSKNATIGESLAKSDWDAYERSWDFRFPPLLTYSYDSTSPLESSYTAWITQNRDTIAEMKRLEEENNRLFIDAYDLADELTPDVPIEQITLTVNPAYRYGVKLTDEEQWARFRQDTMEELVSYAIGCMMGRYSLDDPGLIYANSGNEGFDPSRYPTFPADDDGIVPLTDTEWFNDDAAQRLIEFISVAWGESHLEANLAFLADNLSPKQSESSPDTLRRYLCDKLFKKHLQTYKKRPIYWLFSSGKHKALQCLVYLHRYNEGTLSRVRMDYAVPLLGRLDARIQSLSQDIDAATTTAQANKLRRESEKYKKQLEELRVFDEKLRHYADQRISLDLDDGVKVSYGKFGDLLAEVKAVTGKKPE